MGGTLLQPLRHGHEGGHPRKLLFSQTVKVIAKLKEWPDRALSRSAVGGILEACMGSRPPSMRASGTTPGMTVVGVETVGRWITAGGSGAGQARSGHNGYGLPLQPSNTPPNSVHALH